MKAIVTMVRNGYQRKANGEFHKLIVIPNTGLHANGVNHCLERIVRNREGRILRVEHCNRRRGGHQFESGDFNAPHRGQLTVNP